MAMVEDEPELEKAKAAFESEHDLSAYFGSVLASLSIDESDDLRGGLQSVFDDVSDARLFDETYIGHMLSTPSKPALAAAALAQRINSNTVAREVSIRESALEKEAMEWMMDFAGYEPGVASGTFTTGGSLANLTALYAARRYAEKGRLGMRFDQPLKVFATDLAHYSLNKSLMLLGGPNEMIELVKVRADGFKMDPEDLEKKVKVARQNNEPIMAIFAVAGETETGLVDPLSEISEVAKKHEVFAHADAAYGLFFTKSSVGDLFGGISEFDSVIGDPHKALYTPYGAGVTLFKDARVHALIAKGVEADYLQFVTEQEQLVEQWIQGKGNLGAKRIEGSMGAMPILSVVATKRTLGVGDLSAILDKTIKVTKKLHERITNSGYLVPIHDPELNLLCFSFKNDVRKALDISSNEELARYLHEARIRLDKEIQGQGGYFFSATNLPSAGKDGQKEWVLRACIMNPNTDAEIACEAVDGLESIIKKNLRDK